VLYCNTLLRCTDMFLESNFLSRCNLGWHSLLFFSFFFFCLLYTHVGCLGLIGHLQVYKFFQFKCYSRGFCFMLVLYCSHACVRSICRLLSVACGCVYSIPRYLQFCWFSFPDSVCGRLRYIGFCWRRKAWYCKADLVSNICTRSFRPMTRIDDYLVDMPVDLRKTYL
jgi:hypothetical protein